ncbi:MAG: hypothetical protein ACXU8N_14680 [Telluria sp.]
MPERHADTGIDMRALAWGAAAIAGALALALLAAWFAYGRLHRAAAAPAMTAAPPLLDTAPQHDRAAYEAQKEAELHRLGWVDRQRGIARIPVDDAMRILAAREGKR